MGHHLNRVYTHQLIIVSIDPTIDIRAVPFLFNLID